MERTKTELPPLSTKQRLSLKADSEIPDAPCIWLRIDDAEPQVLAQDAARLDVPTTETAGWIPYPMPDEVLLRTQMHLSVAQVQQLIEALQRWVETGSLTKPLSEEDAPEPAAP